MRPGEIAKVLRKSTATIRGWSVEFADFLSPGVNAGEGAHRNYSEQDFRVLNVIAEMRRRNRSGDEIALHLRQLQDDDWMLLPPAPEIPYTADVSVVPTAAAEGVLDETRRAFLREIARMEIRLLELERHRVADQETIIELNRELSSAQTELELWRKGRLKPEHDG
jgi:DNA-binding transcriptional MerR regulator